MDKNHSSSKYPTIAFPGFLRRIRFPRSSLKPTLSTPQNYSRKQVFLLALLIQSSLFLYLSQIVSFEFPTLRGILSRGSEQVPFKILLWVPYYSLDHTWMNNVTHSYCNSEFIFTSNQTELENVDCIFSPFEYELVYEVSSIAEGRNANIPWIFLLREASINYPYYMRFPDTSINKIFNWSYSIYTDSEFYDKPIQTLYRKLEAPDERWLYGSTFSKEFLRQKKKSALWVVSNCNKRFVTSKRNLVIEALKKLGIEIDIYGKCGKNCSDDCFPELGPQYRFYLAFENSLCVDYITEKIHNGLATGMIPIVYGIGDLSLSAPPNSYIDVMDFNTIEELAERLKFLVSNPQEYFKYFEWRQDYEPPPLLYVDRSGLIFCDMLRQVRERTLLVRKGREELRHVYKDMRQWYNNIYHQKFGKLCPRCLAITHKQIEKPSWIRNRILNDNNFCDVQS